MLTRKPLRLRRRRPAILLALTVIGAPVLPCHADVITDWDAKASAVASPAALGERELAIVDIAMFDAVNSIEPRYKPYKVRLAATRHRGRQRAFSTTHHRPLLTPSRPGSRV